MKKNFRRSMTELHTLVGISTIWVLYFIFVTGTVGYFDNEIDRWMQPDIPSRTAVPEIELLQHAEHRLQQVAKGTSPAYITMPSGRNPFLRIEWQTPASEKGGGRWKHEILNPSSGKVEQELSTGGGRFLYRMHYLLHYMPELVAYAVVSFCSMLMLIALVTGVIIHKKIFVEFFTFRPGKSIRSWLDIHNVFSVLPLPFHLMITYSGLAFLMFASMNGIISASYGAGKKNQQAFFDEVYPKHVQDAPVTNKHPSSDLDVILKDVVEAWGSNKISFIEINNLDTQNDAVVVHSNDYQDLLHPKSRAYNRVSGELMPGGELHDDLKPSVEFFEVLSSLHEGIFAGTILRWLYFFSGLLGCGMLASGAVMWANKRYTKAIKNNQSLILPACINSLNAATVVGLPTAIGIYFWSNRFIPAETANRSEWEAHSLFIVWGLLTLYALVSNVIFSISSAYKKVWSDQLFIVVFVFALIPIINALTSPFNLIHSLQTGDWMMAGFDLTMIAIAGCGLVSIMILRRR